MSEDLEPIDGVYPPSDAGEYKEGLIRILKRIPPGWGSWIRCDKGWYPLICELDDQLAKIDPNYHILQVKEKFGLLRYYFDSESPRHEEMRALVDDAEVRSGVICELTGAPGITMCSPTGWWRTVDPIAFPDYELVENESDWQSRNIERLVQNADVNNLGKMAKNLVQTNNAYHELIARLIDALRGEAQGY